MSGRWRRCVQVGLLAGLPLLAGCHNFMLSRLEYARGPVPPVFAGTVCVARVIRDEKSANRVVTAVVEAPLTLALDFALLPLDYCAWLGARALRRERQEFDRRSLARLEEGVQPPGSKASQPAGSKKPR